MRDMHRELLELDSQPDKTCIIKKQNQIIFTSGSKGVKPMMDFYALYGKSETELLVIDRIMGKGAVILADLIGARIIITPIISEIALRYAEDKKLSVYYKKVVPYIINRKGNGACPIETAVSDINDTEEAYKIICKTLDQLRNK